jgi:hydrogenase maturation protease
MGTDSAVPKRVRIQPGLRLLRDVFVSTQSPNPLPCLILACGNSLRGDDGVGPWLAAWAEQRFGPKAGVHVIARQQWTPELAAEIAAADSVLFIDASIESKPGRVTLTPVAPKTAHETSTTHHLNASRLLGLAQDLYSHRPAHAMLLTVGAASTELKEDFSDRVKAALPRAQGVLEKAVKRFLETNPAASIVRALIEPPI